jgi:hypothetical protein
MAGSRCRDRCCRSVFCSRSAVSDIVPDAALNFLRYRNEMMISASAPALPAIRYELARIR